jgi:hypothetical protein
LPSRSQISAEIDPDDGMATIALATVRPLLSAILVKRGIDVRPCDHCQQYRSMAI